MIANICITKETENMGINADNSVCYEATSEGFRDLYGNKCHNFQIESISINIMASHSCEVIFSCFGIKDI